LVAKNQIFVLTRQHFKIRQLKKHTKIQTMNTKITNEKENNQPVSNGNKNPNYRTVAV
jgi:hypothetical protein